MQSQRDNCTGFNGITNPLKTTLNMDIYTIEKPCSECGIGTIKFDKSLKIIRGSKVVYSETWRCDNCSNTQWQEKTAFVMDLEREGPDLDKSLKDLKKAQDEMFEAIATIVKEYNNNQLTIKP
jgi:hypothetical protein